MMPTPPDTPYECLDCNWQGLVEQLAMVPRVEGLSWLNDYNEKTCGCPNCESTKIRESHIWTRGQWKRLPKKIEDVFEELAKWKDEEIKT